MESISKEYYEAAQLDGATKYAQSMVMYFYRVAFDYSNKGYASAIAVSLFLIIMLITLFQMKMQKKWVNYD